MLRGARFLAEFLDDPGDARGGGGIPFLVVVVEALAGLLPPAALGGERVADILDARRIAVPADVDARQVAHLEGAHRHAEIDMDLVDLLRRGAFHQQLHRLDLARHQHAVADEAVADARDHRDLPDLLRQRHDGREHVVGGLRAADDLEQLHHVRGREEVHAEHVARPRDARGDLVDVEVGGVGGEDRAGFGDPVELAEDLLLDVHALIDRLDDQVAVGQLGEIERRLEQPHRALDLARRDAAARGARLVVLAHRGGAAVERLLRHLDDRHRHARREEVHRDAAAHRPRTDHADAVDRAQRDILGNAVDLRCLALGEEDVALRRGLDAHDQLHEALALEHHAFLIGQGQRLLDQVDDRGGRLEAAEALGVGLAELLEHRGLGADRLDAGARQRADAGDFVGEGDRILDQAVVARQPVDQAGFPGLLRADRIALRHHLERERHARDARQPLGAAGAGEQAELDLGQPELGRGEGDPVMARQRDFAAAAERGAVDRRDHGLFERLDPVDENRQRRIDHRLAEFGDVGAREEGLALAGDDHGLDRGVGRGLRDGGVDPLAHRAAERVHRRIVRQDDEDVAVALGGDDGHSSLLLMHCGADQSSAE